MLQSHKRVNMMRWMMWSRIIVGFISAWMVIGCSNQHEEAPQAALTMSTEAVSTPSSSTPSTPMIAYERTLVMDVSQEKIEPLYHDTMRMCHAPECVILQASLTRDDETQAELKIRAPIQTLTAITHHLGQEGEYRTDALSGEDVSRPISDATQRITMLQHYRESLTSLLHHPKSTIDDLIKIHEQLAQVQSEIENLSGEREHLYQRVREHTLSIRIISDRHRSLISRLSSSVDTLSSALAMGVGAVMGIIAFALPFGLIGWGLYRLYRRRKRSSRE